MSSSTQLSFALRTSTKVRTVHLIGSWDGYQGQIPLSKDSSSSAKPGSWKGTFRFQSSLLKPGQRYWFYYMLDGYQVSHDPTRPFTVEKTTGRKLNTLDVSPSHGSSGSAASKRESRRQSRAIPQGRPISPSNIKCPKPQRPGETKKIIAAGHDQVTLEAIKARLALQAADETDSDSDDSDSDADSYVDSDSDCSDVPSLTSSTSSRSSSTSRSSTSSVRSACSCERYGITRSGHRVKLDCGGVRCASSDDSCSESEDDYSSKKMPTKKATYTTRRHGVVIT